MSFASLKKAQKTGLNSLKDRITADNEKKSYGDDRYWNPSVDKTGNGFAIIRFLPAVADEDMPFQKIFTHSFSNDGRWLIENCPVTIGQDCPICKENNRFWKTGDKLKIEVAKLHKRKTHYHANILVISDPKNPDNEGKVFLFKFGPKIFEKISAAIDPQFEDEEAFDPFDFWTGADFKLKIRNVEGYRNYDRSEFAARSALFDGDDTQLEALWKKQYSLKELVDTSKFKTSQELSLRLAEVMSSDSVPERDSTGDIKFESPKFQSKDPEQKKVETTETEDEDEFAMYTKLLES